MTNLIKALYFVIYLVAGVYSLSGCVERFDADISSDDANVLVVEGAICSGELNKFVLSRSQTINSVLTPRTVKGAKVSVHGSDGSEYVAQEADGYYACQIDGLSPDVAYCLHIEVDGEVYESEPQKPLRTEKIADVMGMQNTPESNIDVLVTPAEPFEPDQVHYYSWTYDETWEVHPDYTTVIYYDTNTKAPVYDPHQFPERGWTNATGSTIIVGSSQNYEGQHIRRFKMYDIDRGDKRMYHRYSGLVHQRAISKAEYEYELARRQASLEMGGLFTPLPSALPTNIHCLTSKKHVIGFVGCALNTSKYRFFLSPVDYSIDRPIEKDNRLWYEDPPASLCCALVDRGLFLCEWNTTMSTTGTPIVHSAWAYAFQLDVRLNGAYSEEPDFWSLKENMSY